MKVAGGFVFQTNNPWLVGPRRRYLVNEAQKSIISTCLRETLRRLIPAVIVAAILIPLVLIGGTLWLAFQGASLERRREKRGRRHNLLHSAHRSRTAAPSPSQDRPAQRSIYHVSGFPRKNATITYTWVDATGKAGAPYVHSLRACRGQGRHRRRQSPHDQQRLPCRPPSARRQMPSCCTRRCWVWRRLGRISR